MRLAVTGLLLLIISASCSRGAGHGLGPEILGVRLGASREEASKRLNELGRLERQERKQQEVWALRDDPGYSHLIVAYDKEYRGVRFVTAVAKEGGRPVRYDEVIDTGRARRESAGDIVTYTLEVPAEGGRPAYVAKAIGGPDHLKDDSVEKTD